MEKLSDGDDESQERDSRHQDARQRSLSPPSSPQHSVETSKETEDSQCLHPATTPSSSSTLQTPSSVKSPASSVSPLSNGNSGSSGGGSMSSNVSNSPTKGI